MLILVRIFKRMLFSLINKVILKHYRVKIGKMVRLNGIINVRGTKCTVFIDDYTILNSEKYAIPIGFPTRCSFWTLNDGKIYIGKYCGLSNTSICSMSEVRIGDHCLLGGGVKIYDTDFHSLNHLERRNIDTDADRRSKPVVIGNDVFIGAGSIILKGTTIGERSIIGAGSVVSGHIPPGEVWAGNPARFVRKIAEENA